MISDIVDLSEDEIETLETKIEKEFNLWSNSKIDQTGLLNFYEIQDLVFLTTLLNGECFIHLNYFETPENPYSLKLSIIEPDRVNTPSNKMSVLLFREYNLTKMDVLMVTIFKNIIQTTKLWV